MRDVERSLTAFGERYLARIYTAREIAYAMAAPSETARRLGARFAAKEAVIKALHLGEVGIDPRTIEVTRAHDGACSVTLSGEAARRAGQTTLSLSLSHEGHMAMAVVIGHRPSATAGRSERRGARRAARRTSRRKETT